MSEPQLQIPGINAAGPVPIKVYGTPCGGTQYAHRTLKALGYDVGHEEVKPDGIVDGFMALGFRPKQRGASEALGKAKVDSMPALVSAHLVRHPLRVAETLWRYIDRQRPFRKMYADVGIDDAKRDQKTALRFWVRTHERLSIKIKPTHVIRLDGTHDNDWIPFIRDLHLKLPRKVAVQEPSVSRELGNKRFRKQRLTWGEWRSMDDLFCERGMKLLNDFGMDIDPWGTR